MKKVILSFALLLTSVTATATAVDEFVCTLKSGATVTWQLSEQPEVEMVQGQFAITAAKTTVFYNAEDVLRFAINKSETAIKGIDSEESASATILQASAGRLVISGCKAGEELAVYSIDGRQVLTGKSDSTGTLTLSTDALPTGVYIMKSQSVNLKFAKQ